MCVLFINKWQCAQSLLIYFGPRQSNLGEIRSARVAGGTQTSIRIRVVL